MPEHSRANKAELPPIPAKRYFTIGEVSDLCAVKPHVLRYWEQEFAQLKPVKRRGNRRYYQHHEVLLIRRIRDLLYEQGFTINGARHRLESEIMTPGNGPSGSGPAGATAGAHGTATWRHGPERRAHCCRTPAGAARNPTIAGARTADAGYNPQLHVGA